MAKYRKKTKIIRKPHNPGGETAPPGLPEDKKVEAWQGVLSAADTTLQSFVEDATKAGAGKGGAFGKGPANLTQAPATSLFFKQLADQSDFQPEERFKYDKKISYWRTMALTHLNDIARQIASKQVKEQALANAWADRLLTTSILLKTTQTPPHFGSRIPPSQKKSIDEHFGGPANYIGYEELGFGSLDWSLEDLFNQIMWVWTSIKNSCWDVVNWLRGINLSVDAVWQRILDVGHDIKQMWYVLRDQVTSALQTIYNHIWNGLVHVANSISGGLSAAWGQITAYIGSLRDELVKYLASLRDTLSQALASSLASLRDQVLASWTTINFTLDAVRNMILSTSSTSDLVLQNSLGVLFPDAWNVMLAHSGLLRDPSSGFLLKSPMDAFKSARNILTGFVKEGYNEIETYLRAQAPITPSKVPTVAATTLATATGFGLAAHLSSAFFEFAHPLKSIGLHQMSAFLADMGSFSAISAGSMGVMIATAVRQPFMYYAQDIFRPLIASEMDLQIMAVKPDITMEDFRRAYAFHGYSERWIDAIQTTMFKEPRYFELSFMLEDANASQDWLYKKARRGGYSVEDSNIFVPGLIKKVLRTQRQDLYVAVGRLYKEGYIDDAQFDEMLAPLELRTEALPLAKQAAAAQFLYDNIYELSRLLREEYIKEVITLGDLEVALTSLGISDAKIDLLLASAMVKKMPKPKHIEKKEADKEAAKMQRKYVTLYTQQYRKELLSADELQTNLVMVGLTPEMAGITVSLEKTRRLEVPSVVKARTTAKADKESQKLYTALYKEQFRDQQLTEEEFTFNLMIIGYLPEEAVTMVRLEQAKAYTPPPIELEPVTA